MSRRIDIELTSALANDSWTWRAAGAKQPKGTLDGSLLAPGAVVGDVIKVEVEQEIDGITVLSVVGGRDKADRDDVLELLPSERDFKPVIETKAKRDRNDRGRDDRRPRRDRDDRGRGRRDRDGRGGDGRDGRDDGGRGDGGRGRGDRNERGGRDDRGGRGRRGGPSFTPPPEIPQRPKPKRLKPGKRNRSTVLAELPEEQRGVAELALQGMGAVRQRLKEENQKAATEGRSPMPEASVLKLAEDLLPKLRVAEWRDRAEAAQRQMEHLDLRDLRSVVAAAGDPAVARDETTAALAAELTKALATKQEQELRLWFGDVDAALAVGRVIRALRLSSQPPKAGVPFPSDIAQRLVDSTNASLAPMDSGERWIAMLEAAAFSPVRASVVPARKPDVITDELMATVKRLAPALPQVAALFEVEVDPKKPMPKPLRPGPRNRKGAKDADRGPRTRNPREQSSGQDKSAQGRKPRGDGDAAAATEEKPTAGRPAVDTATAPTADAKSEHTPDSATPDEPATTADNTSSDESADKSAAAPAAETDSPAPADDAATPDEPATTGDNTSSDESADKSASTPAAETDSPTPADDTATPGDESATVEPASVAGPEPAAEPATSHDLPSSGVNDAGPTGV